MALGNYLPKYHLSTWQMQRASDTNRIVWWPQRPQVMIQKPPKDKCNCAPNYTKTPSQLGGENTAVVRRGHPTCHLEMKKHLGFKM